MIELPSALVMGIREISVKILFAFLLFFGDKKPLLSALIIGFFLFAIWLPQKLVANFGPLSRGAASLT